MLLRPEDFTGATLADAPAGSLFRPLGGYGLPMLVGVYESELWAAPLRAPPGTQAFACANARHKGLVFPKLTFEVDDKSAVDLQVHDGTIGMLVRRSTTLGVLAQFGTIFLESDVVVLGDGLPASTGEIGFLRWNAGLGQGIERRILIEIDVSPAA